MHPSLALAESLARNDALLPILHGLMFNVLSQGRSAEALPWAEKMLDIAKATADADLLVTGHMLVCVCRFWMGGLLECLEHGEKALSRYDEEDQRHLVNLLNHDPKTAVGVHTSPTTWMLGYPDRAVRLGEDAVAHSRQLGHPFNLGYALIQSADLFELRGELEELRELTEECQRLGRENSMPVLFDILAPIRFGIVSIREGKFAEGITLLAESGTVWRASGGKANVYGGAVIAEAMAHSGELVRALRRIEECLEQIERAGFGERAHYAEILRLKGWMLTLKDDLEGAEKNFLASIEWAREQKAKSWELRTSTSLARLWQKQGSARSVEASI